MRELWLERCGISCLWDGTLPRAQGKSSRRWEVLSVFILKADPIRWGVFAVIVQDEVERCKEVDSLV